MSRLLVALVLLLLFVGAVWQPHDPNAIDLAIRHAPPSATHWLGTDQLGRDLLSRLLLGGARTLAVLVVVTLVGVGGGFLLGLSAAFAGGRVETALLRVADLSIIVPSLVVGLTASALFGLSPVTAGIALGVAGIGPYALLAHSLARRALAQPYVLAARALGVSPGGVLFRHVLPQMLPVTATHIGSNAGQTIVAYASLAFLGLGADPSDADWGGMLFEYRTYLFDHPELMIWPGLAIAATVLALNLSLDPRGEQADALSTGFRAPSGRRNEEPEDGAEQPAG